MGVEIRPGASSGTGTTVTSGQATVDFTTGFEQATVTVASASIAAGSRIVCNMAYAAAAGRDLDELEMDQFDAMPGNVSAGVSFDILVTCLTGYGHGQYLIDWHYV